VRQAAKRQRPIIATLKEATQDVAEQEVKRFLDALGPFVVAAETTRMPMLFTNAEEPNYPIIFANDSFVALMGYEREELLAQDCDFFFAPSSSSDGRKRVEVASRNETDTPIEVECRRKDGRVFPAAMYISPVRDRGGGIVQYFSSFIDLTARNEHELALARLLSLQTKLIQLNRVSAMGTMAATLAHELNQPLTSIANYAAGCRLLLAAGTPRVADLAKDLTAIEDGAIRAGAIIGRMRNMSRGGSPKRESFDLNDAVRESVELVLVGSCQGVVIESDVDGLIMVEADRIQIQQVVINLVNNGCEAAAGRPNARVTLTTRVEGNLAIVSVDDTGPGISAGRSLDLFEWTNSAKPNGMGVGLSISRSIVEAHEGTIWLAPRNEGRTRFCFSVPLAGDAVRVTA
jgi:two-component system sensor kinase FixL